MHTEFIAPIPSGSLRRLLSSPGRARLALLALTAALGLLVDQTQAASQETLDPQLEPFRPYIGKTWRGEMKNAPKPTFDIARWERALNGKAIRILHSINDGEYGGETILFWDAKEKTLRYHYFTTAGFNTTGTMAIQDGKITSVEQVTGDANGVTEVKALSELRPDGVMVNRSEYLRQNKWVPGHEITYRQARGAKVKFK